MDSKNAAETLKGMEFMPDAKHSLNTEEWNLITNTINAYMISEAVYAGCELDVFSKINTLACPDLSNIAASIGLSDYSCSILLMCLCCSKLVSKNHETGLYVCHSAASKALCSNNNQSFIPFVRFNHQVQQKGMAFFLNALKSGSNEGLRLFHGVGESLYDCLAKLPGMTKLFHEGMEAYTHFGPKIVNYKEIGQCNLLLDVGGGNGSVSRKYLSEYSHLQAVVLDIPTVCEMGSASNLDYENRLQFISMDIFEGKWAFSQDAILFSHLLEIFSLEKVDLLYKKAFNSLPQGGRLFVWTIVSNATGTPSLQAAKSSAYFLTMASGSGKAYSQSDHVELAEMAGFRTERIYDRSEYDHVGFVFIK